MRQTRAVWIQLTTVLSDTVGERRTQRWRRQRRRYPGQPAGQRHLLPNAVNDNYVTLQSAGWDEPGGCSRRDESAARFSGQCHDTGRNLRLQVQGLAPGGTTTVTLFMPTGTTVTQYWNNTAPPAGSTLAGKPSTVSARVRNFEMKTAMEPRADYSMFVDGGRGDDDGIANGVIVDPGLSVFIEPATLLPDGRLLIVGTDGDDKIVVNPGGG